MGGQAKEGVAEQERHTFDLVSSDSDSEAFSTAVASRSGGTTSDGDPPFGARSISAHSPGFNFGGERDSSVEIASDFEVNFQIAAAQNRRKASDKGADFEEGGSVPSRTSKATAASPASVSAADSAGQKKTPSTVQATTPVSASCPSQATCQKQGESGTSTAAKAAPKAVPPLPAADVRLEVCVVASAGDGGSDNTMSFRMRPETTFGRMMEAWCSHNGVPLFLARFIAEESGLELDPEDTPAHVGLVAGPSGRAVIRAAPRRSPSTPNETTTTLSEVAAQAAAQAMAHAAAQAAVAAATTASATTGTAGNSNRAPSLPASFNTAATERPCPAADVPAVLGTDLPDVVLPFVMEDTPPTADEPTRSAATEAISSPVEAGSPPPTVAQTIAPARTMPQEKRDAVEEKGDQNEVAAQDGTLQTDTQQKTVPDFLSSDAEPEIDDDESGESMSMSPSPQGPGRRRQLSRKRSASATFDGDVENAATFTPTIGRKLVVCKIVASAVDGRNHCLRYRMAHDDPFMKLMVAWCRFHGLSLAAARFTAGSQELAGEDTPTSLAAASLEEDEEDGHEGEILIRALPRRKARRVDRTASSFA
eukprot:TRINITY_DN4536_c0_g1_i1.p1 TRINITY_DN4536_c0_g1~~TRINITY_DN4536_c0_g1_i1.p1  ORF type:complete len:593 (-),score=131.67 TRINITY_DN4536_c0_g1_i1:571-2349(-)